MTETLLERYQSLLREFIARKANPGELQALKRSMKKGIRPKSIGGPYKIPKSFYDEKVDWEYRYDWDAKVVSFDRLEAKLYVFDRNDVEKMEGEREEVTIEWEYDEDDPRDYEVAVYVSNSIDYGANACFIKPPRILDQVRAALYEQSRFLHECDEAIADILGAFSYQMKARLAVGLPAEKPRGR